MDQVRQGLHSTTMKLSNNQYFALSDGDINSDMPSALTAMDHVEQTPSNEKTHAVYMTKHDINGKLFTDQTGRMPVTSNCGHAYIVIFYIFDANYI